MRKEPVTPESRALMDRGMRWPNHPTWPRRRSAEFGWGGILVAMMLGFLVGVLLICSVGEELARQDRIRAGDATVEAQ